MKLFPTALAFFALATSPSVSRADSPANPNSQGTTAPIPTELDGLKFELRLPESKTRFQQGETIRIRLIFSNQGPQTLYLGTFYGSPLSAFEITPRDGFTNPLADLALETSDMVAGQAPGNKLLLSTKPTEARFILNERVRFDRPGTYQIRATTNAVFAVAKDQLNPGDGLVFGGGPSVSSNSVSVEIMPGDAKWQQQQVDAWRAYWAKQTPEELAGERVRHPTSIRPENDLRFLNTQAAAQAMIEHLGQNVSQLNLGREAYFWRSGLVGFPDRLWLINAMKDALKRPDYPVTHGFLFNLANLQALYHVARAGQRTAPDQFTAAKEKSDLADWQLTQSSLTAKQGHARAVTVHALLQIAWHSPLAEQPTVQRHLPRLVALVPDIFGDLLELQQEYLLDDQAASGEWQKVKSPRFVAPLLRAWATLPLVQGQAINRSDLILRRLYELAPKVARPLILKEMASPQPRVSFEVLSLLPDESITQLENTWWANFNKGINNDTTLRLARRYGTPSLKAKFHSKYQIDL